MARTVTREQYFDAALAVLAGSGFKGLNIGVMSKRLGMTSGAFYHHFGNWPVFVDDLQGLLGKPAGRIRQEASVRQRQSDGRRGDARATLGQPQQPTVPKPRSEPGEQVTKRYG
jgi:hypothetical protein